MVLDTACHDLVSRQKRRRGFSFCGAGGETGSGARHFRIACVGYSVCAVFISSSLVSSDWASAIGVGDLKVRLNAWRIANSDWLITMRIWIIWKNAAPFLVSGSGAAFNRRRYIFKQAVEEKSLSLNF